jgi:hypothetical protein
MKISLLVLLVICVPATMYAMKEEDAMDTMEKGLNECLTQLPPAALPAERVLSTVEGLEEFQDDIVADDTAEVSQLRKFTEAERERLIALYGKDKYDKARETVGTHVFGLHDVATRSHEHADLSSVVEQLAISNRLTQEKSAKDDENRADDLARLKKADCRGLWFSIIGAGIAGASALVSILVAVHVIP